jgi:hypothetical protein
MELLSGVGESAAVAAEREGRPHDRGHHQPLELVEVGDDHRRRHLEPARLDRLLELEPVLGPLDGVEAGADQLDAELVENAGVRELAGEVERRLAAHRGQERVRALEPEHLGDRLDVERLEVRPVGEAGVGHDRRRVRVDDDRAEPVLAQHLERLATCVVELRRLADHDRPGADDADRLEVGPPRH